MKKRPKQRDATDLLPEYDFRGGVRGKYAARYATGANVVVLEPDIARVFLTADQVNRALRTLIKTQPPYDRQVKE